MRARFLYAIFFCVTFLFIAGITLSARAQEFSAEVQNESREISGLVMSPFCPGRSLNDCPSSSASELRNKISGMLAEGKKRDEVLTELYKLYGEEVRAMPKKEGWGLFAWLLPAAFLTAGAVFLIVWLRGHSTQSAPVQKKEPPALDPVMAKRIEDEIGQD